jgi:anti-sigma B factor antagonist
MEINSEIFGDIRWVKVSGTIDINSALIFEHSLLKCIDEGIEQVYLDFVSLKEISSAGLGVIVTVHEQLRLNDINLVIVRIPDRIEQLFRLLGIDQLVSTCSHLPTAMMRRSQ